MSGEQTPEGVARFSFTGSGGEYFRIWIVNLLLTMCTLGIYSAWAKVRREQYFHRNTLLAGSGFDYHGKPSAILKGRIIAFALLVLLGASENISPTLHTALLLAAVPIVPWLIQRSLRFRAANTSYRGLRFRHRGTYKEAFVAHIGHGFLAMMTLGIWTPLWMRAAKRFQVGKLSYGTADFACEPSGSGYYGAYFKTGLIVIGMAFASGMLVPAMGGALGQSGNPAVAALLAPLIPLAIMLGYALVAWPYFKVRLANLTWNATTADGRKFSSDQALGSYWQLHAANVLLTLLTLGLFWPWAKVREAAYKASHTMVEAADLDGIVAQAEQQASAVGEEIADVFDLDLAL